MGDPEAMVIIIAGLVQLWCKASVRFIIVAELQPNSSSTRMHRVLFIREILFFIFGHCSPTSDLDSSCHKADLAALARTCRTFKEPALDVLWETLFDLSPLARCLPEACKVDGTYYSFSRPLSDAEWNTLRGYTCRVRSISSGVHSRKAVLFLESITEPLFPNLRSLYWSDLETLPVVHTAVPSLTELSLSSHSIRGVPLQTKTLDILGERCPNIRCFTVSFLENESLHPAISCQLCRWTSLQRVDCRRVTLSTDFILHLPSLSTLKRLSFTLSANSSNHITPLGSVFIFFNLASLKIISTSLKSITTLFSRIQLPKIKELRVSVSEYTSKHDVQEYWTTLRKACPSNTLACLSFENSGRSEQTRRLSLTLVDLLPYKDFGNLRGIDVNLPWSVNLTDADLLDLVSTSPQLGELYINDNLGWKMDGEGGITLSGLVQLLRWCPSLCSASLVIDSRTFTQIPHGLDVSFPPRKTFFLDCLDSHFPLEFYLDFKSVFAALRLIVQSSLNSDNNFDESHDAEDFTMMNPYIRKLFKGSWHRDT